MNLILVWIQGSGKGTQARKILEKHGDFCFFEMGQKLRDFANLDEELSPIVRKHLEEWTLVPMDVIEAMLKHYKENHKENDWKIIFDGIPRSMEQLDMFEKIFPEYFVIFLDLDKEIALKRVEWRRIDPSNGMSFPKEFVGDYSPFTGQKLIVRDDDNEQAVRKRITGFYHNTLPMIAEWATKWKRVYRIDASKSIDEVASTIDVIISAY